jgi:inorganic pyrophosphatase
MSELGVVDALIVVPCIIGLLWSAKECLFVKGVKLNGHPGSLMKGDSLSAEDSQKIVAIMKEIGGYISEGAVAFLWKEYQYMAVYIVVFGLGLLKVGLGTSISFVIGSITSIICGYVGMKIAVFSNTRTTHEAWKSLSAGYDIAIRGGSVMGLSLVSIGVLALYVIVKVFNSGVMGLDEGGDLEKMYDAIAGFGLGGSSIALFGRVGGGIYTKAADVGADLSGKNEYGMDEDDPRNPACIADNVGDNVGDVAGMGADLFGSFAESTCRICRRRILCSLREQGHQQFFRRDDVSAPD